MQTPRFFSILVPDSRRCVEDSVFELVCTCNLESLVLWEGGVVKLPPAYAGLSVGDVVERLCGLCLEVRDVERGYILVFRTLKMGVVNLARLISELCRGR